MKKQASLIWRQYNYENIANKLLFNSLDTAALVNARVYNLLRKYTNSNQCLLTFKYWALPNNTRANASYSQNCVTMTTPPSSQQKHIPTFVIKNQSETSYADITQKNQQPKREQGLIIDCAEGLTLTDYACAIGELIQPKNILSASRISNNRVCLSSIPIK